MLNSIPIFIFTLHPAMIPLFVHTLKKWDAVLKKVGERFEDVEAAAERARVALEGYAIFQQISRLSA